MKRLLDILKNKMTYLEMLALTFILNTKSYASDISDPGDPAKLGEAFEKIKPDIEDLVKPISAVLMFISIVCLGVNIIIKRNRPDERSGLMMGLVPIAVGAFILGCAGLIYEFIMGLAEDF
ncbi:MAG: hypothetical protein MJ244_00605 [Clostridia bacterium]|nr:hypothetical protein [Clostridia bacterium]